MPTVSYSGGPRLDVVTDFIDKELIRQVPGARYDGERKLWTVPRSWAACLQLRGLFGPRLVIDASVNEWAFTERQRVERSKELRVLYDGPVMDELDARLFPHQRADRIWLDHSHDGAMLCNDMGLGKTISLEAFLQTLSFDVLPALVICPNSVKGPWREATETWHPEATPYVLTGATKTKLLKQALTDPTALVIVNYELARTLTRLAPYGSVRLKRCTACGGGDATVKPTSCEAHAKALNEVPFRTVIVDEAHRCFPYATLVLTDEGWLPIGEIVEHNRGRAVLSASSSGVLQWQSIVHRWRNPDADLITVHHSHGTLTCTQQHRIWTARGYVAAKDLAPGDELRVVRDPVRTFTSGAEVLHEELLRARDGSQPRDQGEDRSCEQQAEGAIDLRVVRDDVRGDAVLQRSTVLHPQLQLQAQACHDSQPDVEHCNAGEDSAITSRPEPPRTSSQRRQRSRAVESSALAVSGAQLADGSGRTNKADLAPHGWSTEPLQDRRRQSRVDDRDRGGRTVASVARAPGEGQEEGPCLVTARVDRLEVHERRGADELGAGGRALYDLEVAINHNYFANGVLVSNCKDPKAKQTRACWALAHGPTVEHRFALTGTPIANHVGDLWSIGHLVAPHEYPARSAFIDRYALLNWNSFGGLDIVGLRPDTKDELFGFLDARFRRVTKAQANLGLPPKLRTARAVELPKKMLDAYHELEDQMVTRLDDGQVLFTPNSLVKQTRLLQLSSSFVELNEAGDVRLVDTPRSPKLDVMEEVLEELAGRQLAVCAESRQLIELAAARLDAQRVPYGKITGGVSQSDRDWYREQFQAGKLQVMLFTLGAGGEGITLTAADTLLFLQRSWSLVKNKQAEDRVHRIGSERHESVNLIDVVAPGTVEVAQIARVHHKLALLEEVIRSGGDELQFLTDNDDLTKEPL